ncbi:hypothetical protein TRFO_15125 [Tritrichomonas foetus]|uniref:Uncharacterized protein n=1 Tax=Tritrichomonas foetus TaxID=1144522 RepID=A0A1J4KTL2_9EUKA|nr:hypothetical protein TRFO_15125 [Tritrichomonas foetus]|eukprot:OHT14474.1 hypothetical protein TRFO_15125 [Tritrichomonas foetus]
MIEDKCIDTITIYLKYFGIAYLLFMIGLAIRLTHIEFEHKISPSHPCLNIANVQSEGGFIYIRFENDILPRNPLNLSSYFGYFTSAFNLPLLMPPGSAFKASFDNRTLSISFPIPFIDDYSGTLFCVDEEVYKEPPFQLPTYNRTGVVYEQEINFSIPNFRKDYSDTQILCHGDRSENRWCEVKHIGMAHGKFVMQTQAHFVFPSSFLSLGGRSPPFDNSNERISNEPLLTKRNIAGISVGVAANDEIAILTDPGYYRFSIFGIIFDFMIPAFQTLQKLKQNPHLHSAKQLDSSKQSLKKPENVNQPNLLESDNQRKRIRFFFHNSNDRTNIELIQAITNEPPNSPPFFDSLTIFENIVLGIQKGDEDCDATRSEYARYGHIYNYNHENTQGFREHILNYFKISTEYKNKKPIITFLYTENNENHKILNIEAVKRIVTRSCPFCEIVSFSIDTPNISSILEIASKSTVLIGRSDVGLEHSVWLQPDSHVIEIRPYKFWCDDRYEVAAKISGSHYHSVMNTGKIVPPRRKDTVEAQKALNNCFSAPSYCESQDCYEMLLNQLTELELNEFNTTWNSILNDLKSKYDYK